MLSWFIKTESIVICTIVLGVYFSTLSPSIAGGDSGEIVAEGCQLGTAHPPGYPLITIIIWMISQFRDHGPVAYKINAFCAICTSIACYFLGGISEWLSPFATGGGLLLAVGMFAFSPLIWQYAVTAEVFPLNTMFAGGIVYLVLLFSRRRDVRIPLVGAFVCGLALCNQHTIVLYEAVLILWMLFLLRNHIHYAPSYFVKLSACFICGLLPYAYLPIAAMLSPKTGSWGHVTTLTGLLHHIMRKDYGTFQLFSGASGRNSEGFWVRMEAYFKDLADEQGLGVAHILALCGILSCVISVFVVVEGSTSERRQHKTPISLTKTGAGASDKHKSRTNGTHKHNSHVDNTNTSAAVIDDHSPVNNISISETECQYTPLVLIAVQVFYFAVFHSLANLPLGDKLLFGVHQRFWMQPSILTFAWVGVGFDWLMYVLYSVLVWVLNNGTVHDVTSGKDRKSTTGSIRTQKQQQQSLNMVKSEDVTGIRNSTTQLSNVVSLLGHIISIYVVYQQFLRSHPKMDYSDNIHFARYAAALLDPLPHNAVLLVNYDQQWTSIRYLQVCEGHRRDVTAIQLSMMTYKWFRHKRELYPHIVFPGTYHSYPGSPAVTTEGAFTLNAFLDSNSHHSIFLGGKLNFPDERLSAQYDLVPVGLVAQFVQFNQTPSGSVYADSVRDSWQKVHAALTQLPDVKKYGEDTWEWTIGRDYRDRVMDTAAYMLSAYLSVPTTSASSSDPQPLIDAVYWLESSKLLEESIEMQDGGIRCPTALLKNVGLAHVHLIQNKHISSSNNNNEDGKQKIYLPSPSRDWFDTLSAMHWPAENDSQWKSWSSDRFVLYWGEFLSRPEAKKDPQFGTIKKMYETATKALRNSNKNN